MSICDEPSQAQERRGERVLVCGGRNYDRWPEVRDTLNNARDVRGVSLIITGGASGADRLAERWAQHERIPVCVFPANWQFLGRKAGPLRNQAMLDFAKPHLVVAFPGGRGTEDMVNRAIAAGLPIMEISARDASPPQSGDTE